VDCACLRRLGGVGGVGAFLSLSPLEFGRAPTRLRAGVRRTGVRDLDCVSLGLSLVPVPPSLALMIVGSVLLASEGS